MGGAVIEPSVVLEMIMALSATLGFAAIAIALVTLIRTTDRKPRYAQEITPGEAKRRAKRENERIKLTASFLNGAGIAVLLATAIIPIFKTIGAHPEPLSGVQALAGFGAALGFHLLALWVLALWRSEE